MGNATDQVLSLAEEGKKKKEVFQKHVRAQIVTAGAQHDSAF